MHGGADRSVNPEQSLNLAQRLQKMGSVYELVVYAEDNPDTFLSNNKEDRDRRAAGWFKRHMKKVGQKLRGKTARPSSINAEGRASS